MSNLLTWREYLLVRPPEVKRVVFEHYRIPEDAVPPLPYLKARGKTPGDLLFHYRKGLDGWLPFSRGGKTVCHLVRQDGQVFVGEAVCSLSDPFSYGVGRELAFSRALAQAGVYMDFDF